MIGNDLIKIIKENNLENAEFRIYDNALMFNLKSEVKIDVNEPQTGQPIFADSAAALKAINRVVAQQVIEELNKTGWGRQ